MGAGETSYRLYNCRSCAQQVQICRYCDRGNQYCAGECAQIRRRDSQRRAGQRYQRSYHGARRHAARQRIWRKRRAQKVTHQGSLASAGAAIVVPSSITTTQETHADIACVATPPSATTFDIATPDESRSWPVQCRTVVRARCCFCGRMLSRFARFGPLRGGP